MDNIRNSTLALFAERHRLNKLYRRHEANRKRQWTRYCNLVRRHEFNPSADLARKKDAAYAAYSRAFAKSEASYEAFCRQADATDAAYDRDIKAA